MVHGSHGGASRSSSRWTLRPLVIALLTLVLTVPPLGGPTPALGQSLEQKEREAQNLRTEVEVLLAQLEEANGRREAARAEVASLTATRDELQARIAAATSALNDQARTRYKLGTTPRIAMLLGGSRDIGERASLMAVVESRRVASIQQATGLRDSLASTEVVLSDRLAELEALTADLDARQAEVNRRLQRTEAQVADLRARKARQQAITRGAQNGVYACIFDRGVYHYVNSWGAPRSGGRAHKGTDVMAPRRAKVYAFTNGRVERMKAGGIGGIVLYLRGDDGHRYYYAHLDGYADGVRPGGRVEAGQHIGYNGSTGNADYSAPHVHFEVHPGGGSATNPYHWLTPVCP